MKGILERIDRWRFSRQSGIGRALWPKVLIALGILLFSLGFARTAFSLKARSSLRTDLASLAGNVADLESAVMTGAENGKVETEGLFFEAVPPGGVPGPILKELFSLLESRGIYDFEYRMWARLQTDDADEQDVEGGGGEDDNDSGGSDGDETWNGDAWESETGEDEGEDEDEGEADEAVVATPGLSLYHWKIDLALRAPYGRTIEFLGALAGTPRHWRTSAIELERQGHSLQVNLLLETFTRPIPDGREPRELGPWAFHNPFLVGQQGPGGAVVPEAPSLRAILSGAAPRAWIGQQIVTAGESVAQWTVEEIDDDGVWIRHTTGHRVRLSVGG